MADARGKRLSPDAPAPYEYEALDTHAVLDWIVKQPWSDGKVGMIGGSYSGFTAWAATKRRHPALKGIAVSAAAIPGQGLPMYNNVFLNANYQWAFYVTNNKLLDEPMNNDGQRWWKHAARMVRERPPVSRDRRRRRHAESAAAALAPASGATTSTGSPWCRTRAISRASTSRCSPSPATTTTARSPRCSTSKQHLARGRDPEHYLVIGPYDHLGTHWRKKPEVLREYTIDPVAQIDSQELKLEFMDYVLKGKPKPALLKDNDQLRSDGRESVAALAVTRLRAWRRAHATVFLVAEE